MIKILNLEAPLKTIDILMITYILVITLLKLD